MQHRLATLNNRRFALFKPHVLQVVVSVHMPQRPPAILVRILKLSQPIGWLEIDAWSPVFAVLTIHLSPVLDS
jgi:hypothetical protein